MIPDLQSSLLCDDVRQENNGKFLLIGLFDVIGAPSFPFVFQRMCIVNRWCCGEGEFREKTRIASPNGGNTLIEGKEILLRMPSGECTVTNVEFFLNISFPMPGTYWIEIVLDGDLRLRYPLRVNQITPPNREPPPGAGPGREP